MTGKHCLVQLRVEFTCSREVGCRTKPVSDKKSLPLGECRNAAAAYPEILLRLLPAGMTAIVQPITGAGLTQY